jgi:hypothetical protein
MTFVLIKRRLQTCDASTLNLQNGQLQSITSKSLPEQLRSYDSGFRDHISNIDLACNNIYNCQQIPITKI